MVLFVPLWWTEVCLDLHASAAKVPRFPWAPILILIALIEKLNANTNRRHRFHKRNLERGPLGPLPSEMLIDTAGGDD